MAPTSAMLDWRDWRAAARKRLPGWVFDFLEGGADEETALQRNLASFRQICLIPEVLKDSSRPDTSGKILDIACSLPVIFAPTGLNDFICPMADQKIARVAVSGGIPFVLSTAANSSIGEVKTASDRPPWFQLYMIDQDLTRQLIAEAERQECPVLMVTVDAPVSGRRSRDLRNGLSFRKMSRAAVLRTAFTHPGWSYQQLRGSVPGFPQLESGDADGSRKSRLFNRAFDAGMTWDDLSRIRDQWKHKLVIKGILSVDDTIRASRLGADGIVVSNHGGRQLDSAPPPLAVLPEIAAAADPRLTVLMDGGVRSGEDIGKALALGAHAVMIGRLPLYGLAAADEKGVAGVISTLNEQLLRTMALTGCRNLAEVKSVSVMTVPS